MTLAQSEVKNPADSKAQQVKRTTEAEDLRWMRQVLYVSAHGFELALVAVITFVGLILLVPVEKVFQHLCESIATIALVHCVDTVRIIADRVATARNYQWRATELGCTELAGLYHEFAEAADCERGRHMAFTVVTAVLWLVVSVSYACYLSPISGGHSHLTLQSYLTRPTSVPNENTNDDHQQVQNKQSASMLPEVPALFLDWCVGACAGVAFVAAIWKVCCVSVLPEEVTLEFFIMQLGLREKLRESVPDGSLT